MPISMKIEQSVQITAFCHQRVSVGITYEEDATDDQIQAMIDGPVEKGFRILSKAVRRQCDDMRAASLKELQEQGETYESSSKDHISAVPQP